MVAVNPSALSILAATVSIALIDEDVPALADNLSNHAAVVTALDALTWERMASVTDLKFGVNPSDKKIEQKADDTAFVYQAYLPSTKITFNWLENGEVDPVKMMLGLTVVDVAASSPNPAFKVTGQNLKHHVIPRVAIKIEGMDDVNGHKEVLYQYDSAFAGEFVKTWADIIRTGEVPSTAMEFQGNEYGFWLLKTERI